MIDEVTAIATIPAVLALVTIAKDTGMPPKLSPILAVVLGIVLQTLQALTFEHINSLDALYPVLAHGLILGLSASGLYDGAKLISPTPEYTARHAKEESL